MQIGERRETGWGNSSVVRCDIPPLVQFRQVTKSSRVRWVGSRQIQREAETFKVLPHVLQVWIAVIKDTMGRELSLDEHVKGRRTLWRQ